MATTKFFILNGVFQQEDDRMFSLGNRALTHGDCIMETIHSCGDRLCFFDDHMAHLREGMALAQMQIPPKFMNKSQEFYDEVSRLLSKNRTFHSASITIMVYRSAITSLHTPDKTEYIITEDPVSYMGYELNKDGLKVDIFEDYPMPATIFSAYRTHDNTLMRSMIRKQCISKRVNDMLLINSDGHITESSIGGNIFLISGNTLSTPPLADGCMADIFRQRVLDTAKELGLNVEADRHISKDDLQTCGEIFLGSTTYGIKWIGAYRSRRFIKSKSQLIHNRINEIYQAERTEQDDALTAII